MVDITTSAAQPRIESRLICGLFSLDILVLPAVCLFFFLHVITTLHFMSSHIYASLSAGDIKEMLDVDSFVYMHLQSYNKAYLYIINVKKLHIKALI